jgi:membrane protein
MTNADPPRTRQPRANAFTLGKQLIGGVVTLAKLEIQHARQEVGENLGEAKRAALLFGIAAGLALLTLIAFVCFIVLLIAIVLPPWLAALIVFIVLALLAALFAWRGTHHIRNPTPQRTIESVKEDIAWAKRLIKRD